MSQDPSPDISGATHVARQLVDWGLTHAFCVGGADIATFIEALEDEPAMTAVFAAHEFSAGAMADGFSRVAGAPALAVAIGGPGAHNVVAATATAARDRSSVLFITGSPPGQPALTASLPGWPDDVEMFRAAGAMSVDAHSGGGLETALKEAAESLGSGRAVHLRFSVDAQRLPSEIQAPTPGPSVKQLPSQTQPDPASFFGRVVLAVGAEALDHAAAIRKLSASGGLPVVTDMLARGVIPEGSEFALGHRSFMPHPAAVAATDVSNPLAADLVFALGAKGAFQLELETSGVEVVAIPNDSLEDWLDAAVAAARGTGDTRSTWLHQLQKLKYRTHPTTSGGTISHDLLVGEVADALGPSAIHVIDAGQFHLVAPVRLVAKNPRTILTGSELVSMGWSIGAAIGAKCAAPSSPVVAYVGDGSFLMHGLDVATAARHEIPVLFVVANNGVLGSVRRNASQDYYEAPVLSPVALLDVARACGVETIHVRHRHALRHALDGAADLKRPRVLVVDVPEVDDAAWGPDTGVGWLDSKAEF